MKHTEGPWIAIARKRTPKEHEHGMKATIMARGHRVAIVDGPSNVDGRDTWEANVLLIRSAPELLDACLLALGHITGGSLGTPCTESEALAAIQEAIAKAGGHE